MPLCVYFCLSFSPRVCLFSRLIVIYGNNKKWGEISVSRGWALEMNTVPSLLALNGTRSSIFPKCFCKSRQFIFVALCQYSPRCRHPEYTRNSCGFAVWMDVKFRDGLPKRWENKCLDCYSSANLDSSLMLPASWGQGVYKTWVWSADCGFKPNGHTICHLLPKIIKPPTLGQTLRLYLYSHRVRRSWYFPVILLGYKIKMICHPTSLLLFSLVTFSFG